MEAVKEVTGGGKRRHADLNGGYGERVDLRQLVALHRHQPAEQPRWRRLAGQFEIRPLATPPPGGPLRHNPQPAPETGSSQPPPKLGTIATSRLPFSVQLGEVGVQSACPATEHVAVSATQHAADQLAASARPTRDLLDRRPRAG